MRGNDQMNVQNLVGNWWVRTEQTKPEVGLIVKACLPYVEQIPHIIEVNGRSSATEHYTANFKKLHLNISNPPRQPTFPTAPWLYRGDEISLAIKSKIRPAIIIGISDKLNVSNCDFRANSKRHKNSYLLVAPYYTMREGNELKVPQILINRIRLCMYRHLMWAALPFAHADHESMLRLDHAQPIGNHHNCFKSYGYKVSPEAMPYFIGYLHWFIFNKHRIVEINGKKTPILKEIVDMLQKEYQNVAI